MVDRPADLVIRGGTVLVADLAFRRATAVAVRAGRIVAVGDDADIRPTIGSRTEILDVAGRTVLPGINDSHLHLGGLALNRPPVALDLRPPAVSSLADIRDVVARAAARTPRGQWIRGAGWHPGYLDELRDSPDRQPDRRDLDDTVADHPVALIDFSCHTMWLNTAGLRAVGVDPDGPVDQPGFATGADGRPTGLVFEAGQALVGQALPRLEPAALAAALRSAVTDLHREGITSYTEPGLGAGGLGFMATAMYTPTLDAYLHLAAAGELAARLSVLLLPTGVPARLDELRANLDVAADEVRDGRRLAILGVKVFADGIPPTHTAWMNAPYCGTDDCGALVVAGGDSDLQVAELRAIVREAHRAGLQVGVHAVGDHAVDAVVDAFAAAEDEAPGPSRRHYVIHGSFTSPTAVATMAARGYGLNWTPYLLYANADNLRHHVGADRVARMGPVGSAIRAGVAVAASSDAPVTPTNWRRGLAALLDRRAQGSGEVVGPDERLDLAQAVRAYTANGAWQDHAENWKGTVEAGKVADLCVLDGDLDRLRGDDLADTPVYATVFDGEVVYQR